jgi:hypothetical protein
MELKEQEIGEFRLETKKLTYQIENSAKETIKWQEKFNLTEKNYLELKNI